MISLRAARAQEMLAESVAPPEPEGGGKRLIAPHRRRWHEGKA
jgi:hypothetical protein